MKLPWLVGKSLRSILMLGIAFSPLQVRADVTVSQTGKVTGGVAEEYTKKLRVKGLKLRVDSLYGKESRTVIYDLETGKRFRLDAGRKVAFVLDISTSGHQAGGGVITAKITRAISPTGKQSEIVGKSCTEYTFDLRIPHALSSGRSTLERESGTVCASQSIAEGIELTNFVHEARKRGYTQAASSWAPTNSVNGVYFYGDEPNGAAHTRNEFDKGRLAAQSSESLELRSATQKAHVLANRAWKPSEEFAWLTKDTNVRKIQPDLTRVTVPTIMTELGVSEPYASDIRAGKRIPHQRHWPTLARLAGVTVTE